MFSISGESRETERSDFCTLSAEGKALKQHLELITCVSQLTGGQWASRTGSYKLLGKTRTQWLLAVGKLETASAGLARRRLTPFWLTWEDKLPVWVPPQPSDVVARRWSVHIHTQKSNQAIGWGIPLIGKSALVSGHHLADTDSFPLKPANITGRPAVPAGQLISWRWHEQLLELIQGMVGLKSPVFAGYGCLLQMGTQTSIYIRVIPQCFQVTHRDIIFILVLRAASKVTLSRNGFSLLFTCVTFSVLWALLHLHKY